ncbi:MAG: glycosyltransferase family 4 protein [Leptospirales bacterium]
MRILHLDCSTGFGGQERDHITEAHGFVDKGHEYILGVRSGTLLEDAAKKETRTLSLPLRSNMDLESFRQIRKVLVDEKIDVLVTTSYIDNWIGALAARSLGSKRPLIIRQRHILNTPHNLFPFRHMCDKLVVVSDVLRIFFIEQGIPFWHVVSIHRGISVTNIPVGISESAARIRGDLSLPAQGPVALQIGTFQKDKGHFLMLEALGTIWKKIPDFIMIFLGEGPLKEDVIAAARRKYPDKIGKQLVFRDRESPEPYFSIASVSLLPSIRESLSLVTMESMLHGIPVVAFRVGGIPEIFNVSANGKMVRPQDSGAFAEGVIEVLKDPEMTKVTLQSHSEKIIHRFSIERSVQRTELLYESEIKRIRSGKRNKNPYQRSGGAGDPFL